MPKKAPPSATMTTTAVAATAKAFTAAAAKNIFRVSLQVDDDPSQTLANTNNLLATVGISAKKVTSIGELTRVASSMFVAVFESLFHVRLEGIIRNPQTKDEYAHNAQRVIDSLSERIQMDLQHITGDLIVRGDIGALSNLVHIFIRIVSMTSQESQAFSGMDIYLKGKKESRGRSSGGGGGGGSGGGGGGGDGVGGVGGRWGDDDLGDSISTHESTFENQFQFPAGDVSMSHDFLRLSADMPGVDDFLKSSRTMFQQDAKLEAARRRRVQQQAVRDSRTKMANRRRTETSIRALQKRWVEDTRRGEKAHELRQQTEEHVMLRKMYRGLLKKMHEWKADEHREVRRKEVETKEEAKWHLQSLQMIFDDRLQMLHDQIAQRDLSVVKAQRQMVHELRKSFQDQQQQALGDLQDVLEHKRQHELMRRREAQKNLLALVSVEKWDAMLRSHEAPGEAIRVPDFKPRQRRSRSAPPASRSRLNVLGGDSVRFHFAGFGSSLPTAAEEEAGATEGQRGSNRSSPTPTSTIKEKDFVL